MNIAQHTDVQILLKEFIAYEKYTKTLHDFKAVCKP